ncbi:MAG: iron ABC transporter permease [Proteobacteria bacterium]|nr:iron ABC transporter permease [Pseudomonadota bacterium]
MIRVARLGLWLGLVLALLSVLSLLVGRVWMSPGQLLGAWRLDADPLAALILIELRLPRTVLALLVGAALGLSGAVLQGLTRNPLAEPGLLGVSSGAALGAVIAIHSGLALVFPLATPLLGLAGAFVAALLTLSLGRGEGVLVLVLAGSAVSGVMLAGTALALNMAANPYAAYEISMWLMGSLADKSWDHVLLAGPFLLAGLAVLAVSGRGLDALSLGETQARSLGVDLSRLRLQVLAGTALAVGAATAVAGAVGFIGLLAPHLVRPLVGHQPRRVLWPATLAGAALLLAADLGTRLLPFTQELKLGVLTVLVGTPFFVMLVLRLRKVAP